VEHTIRYADSGGIQIAYEVTGGGERDVVMAFDWASHLELFWTYAKTERFLRRLGSFSRLIMFDVRGMGLSDPVTELPPLEQWMDDVFAVMDAVGSERAAMIGHGHGGQLGMLAAASHPERIDALVTINSFARLARAQDYPAGMPIGVQDRILADIERYWGSGEALALVAPDIAGDLEARRVWAAMERAAGSPKRAMTKQRLILDLDVREVLPSIRVPTLVVQSGRSRYVIPDHGLYLAEHIAGARYVELDDRGHWPWVGPDAERLFDEVERAVTGSRVPVAAERVLATVAFTDVVGSTRLAAELGDRRWRELLETHDSVAAREVEAAHGRVVKQTGDGMLATFDGPARAIGAVGTIARSLAPLGLEIRGGVHTGEVEIRGSDVGGLAVHIGARISELAGPGEVLVSSTVRDLVAGAGLSFEERGSHELRGIPGAWRLYAVA
jgi:class 3 adenylate cyclase